MNIVLIIIDTLRYDHIAASAGLEVYTPNLDKLVARSWNFHRAFAASFPTIPHRNDVIRGRYGAPFHPWQPLDADAVTLPHVLRAQGYCSQLIHDTPHLVNGGHNFDYPFDAWKPIRGAEVDRAWITDSWDYMENWASDPLFDLCPIEGEELLRTHHAITCYVHTNHGRKREEDWNVAQLFTTAAQFLRDNASRENFFLWVDCFDPHEPWDAPPEFMKLYDKTPGYDGSIDPRAFHIRNDPNLSVAAQRRIQAMYKAKVSFVDKWLGVFLDTLEETGLAKKTAVLLTSDHGTKVGGQDGNFGKSSPPKESESHVPFILHVPGAGAGESDLIVQPQDIFTTVMNIAGCADAVPGDIESYNLLESVRRVQNGGTGPRDLALTGTGVHSWRGATPDTVLFSAFDNAWRLGVAADPAACKLQRLGSASDVAQDHPTVVRDLHTAAIDEIARRGLDPALVAWLRSKGTRPFPTEFRVTDAKPIPEGWRAGYWGRFYTSLGLPS
jgi:arylsulfatase A-like enzyme